MEYRIVRDPVSGIYNQIPVDEDVEVEETVAKTEDSVVKSLQPKRKGRPKK